MHHIRDMTALVTVLTACAGPAAAGQSASTGSGLTPNIYEVAPEQLSGTQEVPQERGFIEVSGTGSVTVDPDRATMSFALETRGVGAADAASQNADIMDRVLAAVRAAGFPDLDLRTHGYSVRPEYSSGNQRVREIVAYTALNNVTATTSDVDGVGRLIDLAIGSGANRVTSIGFYASDTEAARREALAEAVRHARSQAEVIAESLGHELGPALEVRGGAQRPTPIMARATVAFEAQAAPTPIEAGGQTVSASVTVRFALGPERRP